MNRLLKVDKLNNRYYAYRHAESVANYEGIIISDPANGIEHYGLTEKGRRQAAEGVSGTTSLPPEETLIYCSDFKRTMETAIIAAHTLGVGQPLVTPLLRERFFGRFEKGDNSSYEKVWIEDKIDASHTRYEVESIDSVVARATGFIMEMEGLYNGKKIIMVSHGDILQILYTAFLKVSPTTHRDYPHLHNAELREYCLAP